MYVFDTNIFVDFLRGRLPLGLKLIKDTDPRLIKVPAIVKAELLVGACKSANSDRSRKAVEELLVNFEVLPFDDRCAGSYAAIRAKLEQAGNRVESSDLMIAATALSYDAVLATNDYADFSRISGLKLMSLAEVDCASS